MRQRTGITAGAIAVLSGLSLLGAETGLPDWAREAIKQPVPEYSAKASVVVLLKEEHLTIQPDGRRSIQERGVLKVLQRTGGLLRASRTYDVQNGRIRDMQAWIVSAAGRETTVRKDQILDVGLSERFSYEDIRAKVIESAEREPGTIFAYQFVEEEKTVFTQYHYSFQTGSPVIVSRFLLTLPVGWESRAILFNTNQAAKSADSERTQMWELRNLPFVEAEEYSPGRSSMMPAIGVTALGPADKVRAVTDWSAVSAWMSELTEPPAAVDDTISAKAGELTRGMTTELERIRAIARFVQQTNYISVQLNLNNGGGYTPHRAADVLRRNYGDCKDKATLMRALLRAAGIESWMSLIYSGDRQRVRPEWASPLQFNHVVVAIRVSPATKVPATIEHPVLGSLLFFDPTASTIPVGGLPGDEQGSFTLIVAPKGGNLLRVPLLAASSDRTETNVEATLDGQARLAAKLQRRYFGENAASIRLLARDARELRQVFETSFVRRLGAVELKGIDATEAADHMKTECEFQVRQFGQSVGGRLLIIRPGSLLPSNEFVFRSKERKLPIELPRRVRHDRVLIQIPAGFREDEVPAPVKLETQYGTYIARWTVRGDQVEFTQDLETRDIQAPATEHEAIRAFFEQASSSQQGAVVLTGTTDRTGAPR